MHPELILIACAILAVFLVPSLITARPHYLADSDADPFAASTGASGQPAE
jgi:hypothetical protein